MWGLCPHVTVMQMTGRNAIKIKVNLSADIATS